VSSSYISCTSYSKHHGLLRFKDYFKVTAWQVPHYMTLNTPSCSFSSGILHYIP
jgi:hypothetical protein